MTYMIYNGIIEKVLIVLLLSGAYLSRILVGALYY